MISSETLVDVNRIQYLAIFGSLLMLLFLIELVRRKKIKEEYAIIWLVWGGLCLVLSVWRGGLTAFSWLIGIAYPPAALFFLFISTIFLLLIHYSIIISKLTDMNKTLVQEVGLLKMELQRCRENMKEDCSTSSNNR